MSFMAPTIEHGQYYAIETTEGTEIIPLDVCGIVETSADLAEYLQGEPDEPEEQPAACSGWLWRMSAPGYLDCTDWSAAESEEQAARDCLEMYGNDCGEPEDWESELRGMIPLRLQIETGNSAFENRGAELARILRHVATEIEQGNWRIAIQDANGNQCGTISGHDV